MKSKVERNSLQGWVNGFLGILIFSGSLPATRIAVLELDPVFLTVLRASIAGTLALMLLVLLKEKPPQRHQILPLIVVALGVVIGFPLMTALALQHVTSAHSIVFLGLLPLTTAIFGVIRAGERPGAAFWVFSIIGSMLVVGFALSHSLEVSVVGDAWMLAAILACGLGYAEGAKLSRTLGGWQVISMALVLSLPFMVFASLIFMPHSMKNISAPTWISLFYVSLFSMLIGFIFWYRGLAQGGIASVGQLQLLQPFFGLALAAGLLHEEVSEGMLLITVGVILCVAASRRFAK